MTPSLLIPQRSEQKQKALDTLYEKLDGVQEEPQSLSDLSHSLNLRQLSKVWHYEYVLLGYVNNKVWLDSTELNATITKWYQHMDIIYTPKRNLLSSTFAFLRKYGDKPLSNHGQIRYLLLDATDQPEAFFEMYFIKFT